MGDSCLSHDKAGNFLGWPEGLPLSCASRVVFSDSMVVKADVQRWSAGMRGPCVITQDWYKGGNEMPDGVTMPDWDLVRIRPRREPSIVSTGAEDADVSIELVGDYEDDLCLIERQRLTVHGVEYPHMRLFLE